MTNDAIATPLLHWWHDSANVVNVFTARGSTLLEHIVRGAFRILYFLIATFDESNILQIKDIAIRIPIMSSPNHHPLKDLTIDNITENVHAINSKCDDPRMKFLFEKLVTHIHDFARETRLTTTEWEASIQFLTSVGQICSPVRQEFILLSDILGLSLLVDSIDHPKPKASTEGTVLGPFHTHEAEHVHNGSSISKDPDGEPMLVVCTVKDTHGKPIPNAKVDVWETDSKGFYDVQYSNHDGPDGRAVVQSDDNGEFHFQAIVPVPYPIPNDGPVGKLLEKLHRHPYRPSHFHFMFDKQGYDRLIT